MTTTSCCVVAEVNEGSTAYLTVTLKDKLGVTAQPSAFRYRIDNFGDKSAVLAWTDATPALGIAELTIPPELNSVANGQRVKRVTIEATYGSEKLTQEWDYEVSSLRFIE